jgi:methionine synthase II (cobalamin-independent)
MVKVLNKEIKELEKHKAKTQKIYEKMTGGAKEEVIDENYDLNEY